MWSFLSAQVCAIKHSGSWQNIRGHCCMSTTCTSASSTGTNFLDTMGPEADHNRDSRYRTLRPQHPMYLSAPFQREEDISTATINQQEPCHWHSTILMYRMKIQNTDSFQCPFSPMDGSHLFKNLIIVPPKNKNKNSKDQAWPFYPSH